jgi:hypothetical protein
MNEVTCVGRKISEVLQEIMSKNTEENVPVSKIQKTSRVKCGFAVENETSS